ncbi:wax synthase family protein [Aspergillus affinis]|uniref:wax synthase family protein n=1 Tax=Aspergillus affinis TaxID=1070780 RepID=UPI0022FE8C3B|nr:uncharacterized protein KD926_000113 [Aspergillus affinis]KAI9037697.1 hypothetical protein KD926_000113 [Aspergillus affinis]
MADDSGKTLLKVTFLFALQILLPAVLVVLTPRCSVLRFAGIPLMSFFAYHIYFLSPQLSNSVFHNSFLACEGIIAVTHCINLLLLHSGVTWDDLVRHGAGSRSAGFIAKVLGAARLVVSLRGVNTGWEVKNLPSHPSFLTRERKSVSTSSFLLRQVGILAWQYLFLDLLLAVTLQEPPENTDKFYSPGMEFAYLDATAEQWFIRAFTPFVSWYAVSRLLLDSTWRALSVIFVGAGLDTPEDWRPLFGSMWQSYTLRHFWGKFWHQILRWPFTSLTSFVTRDILQLPHPSLVERYTNISLVFLMSGILHGVSANIMGLSAMGSGALSFFPSFALGIIIEDTIQAAWTRITSPRPQATTPIWQKLVGFIWVQFWMSVTAPWYMYPSRRILANQAAWAMPYNVTAKLGIPSVLGLLGIYGVFVKFVFETSL